MLVINSYTINQFDSYFDNLTIDFTDHFQQDEFTTFNLLTQFQSSTQLQLEIYYRVKKLTMEEKIIAVIQHIRFKSKQRVTSQRIFRFISKGAVSIGCELFQDCIHGLEIESHIYKKKWGKNAFLFINPIAKYSKKMTIRIMWKKLINPLNHLKQLKKWNVLLTKFLKISKT